MNGDKVIWRMVAPIKMSSGIKVLIILLLNLQNLVQSQEPFDVVYIPLEKVSYEHVALEENPGMIYQNQRTELFRNKKSLESQRLLPDISLNYFQGTNEELDEYLSGYMIGLRIPLLFSGNSSRIKASKIARSIAEQEAIDYRVRLQNRQADLLLRLNKYDEMLAYFPMLIQDRYGKIP